jgi:hypothetical protein
MTGKSRILKLTFEEKTLIIISKPQPKIATNPTKYGAVRHERWTGFLQKRGPNRHLFLFNDDTWEKTEGGYWIWACDGQKPPSISPNSSPSRCNSSRKIKTVMEKRKSEKRASKMASILPAHGTCEKNERSFCFSSCYGEKILSVS